MAEFKAPDGGYLFNAEQFHVTKDVLGRPVGGVVDVPVVVNGKPGLVITLTCDDISGGAPTDSNHLTNKQYVDKAIIDKFKAYLESEEGKAWIKTLLGITGG